MLSTRLTRVGWGFGLSLLGLACAAASTTSSEIDRQAQRSESVVAKAQQTYQKVGKAAPGKNLPNMKYVPQYMRPLYSNLNPAQLTAAQRQGLHDVQHILKKTPLVPKATQTYMTQAWAQSLGKKGMGIADASLAANRAKVLQFLGFHPQDANRLFYFVSFSMPIGMLRSYAEQALWDGGILVFKGPLPHVQLATFITKYLNGLVGTKGASATVTIDPRLYDVFGITEAPTIVYSTVPENQVCRKVHLHVFHYDNHQWTYPVCDRVNPKEYWKIEGAVTSGWALRQFKKAGAPGVTAYIHALAKGGTASATQAKVQQPYKGPWATAPSPAQLQAIAHTVASFGEQTYQTPLGLAVGPKMQIKPGQGVQPVKAAAASTSAPSAPGAGKAFVKDGVTFHVP